jgi:hypothetical protein
VTGRRERRCRKLLDDLKERRGYSHLKEEALDRTIWRARFGRGFGPVVRQTTKWMTEYPTEEHPWSLVHPMTCAWPLAWTNAFKHWIITFYPTASLVCLI